ncbi:hypothetical protein [Rothia kristinae]|uniref:hypothetical protein n=1 Tax=Rothia kristinae TaxID=37923 RepID=UPI0016439D38|nr:hypothetical protein [Rothia kristinae]
MPQRLHPMKPLPVMPVDAECDELVQPGHQHSRAVFPEPEHLGGFGVDRVGEPLRVKAVAEDVGVLPEQLIEQEVGVGVDRSDCDMPLRFRRAQHVRAEQHHVTGPHRALAELAEQDRTAVTHDDELHAVIRDRADRTVDRAGSRENGLEHRDHSSTR